MLDGVIAEMKQYFALLAQAAAVSVRKTNCSTECQALPVVCNVCYV